VAEKAFEQSIIIGNGWSALATLVDHLSRGVRVTWVKGTATHLSATVDVVEPVNVAVLQELARRIGAEVPGSTDGSFIRELKNKSFRIPHWLSEDDDELCEQARDAYAWAAESNYLLVRESRIDGGLNELEAALRGWVDEHGGVERIVQEVPVVDLLSTDAGAEVELGSGERLAADVGVYADRWQDLRLFESLPPTLKGEEQKFTVQGVHKRHSPSGAVQIELTHDRLVAAGVEESFVLPTTRESGEKHDRHALGHFFEGGGKSAWTLFLTPEEVESNQLIARKLRRVKQSLNRAFVSEPWVVEGQKFLDGVIDESVRFEDGAVFQKGAVVTEPLNAGHWTFLGDQWGLTTALKQVTHLMGVDPAVVESVEEPESVDEALERASADGVGPAGSAVEPDSAVEAGSGIKAEAGSGIEAEAGSGIEAEAAAEPGLEPEARAEADELGGGLDSKSSDSDGVGLAADPTVAP
jgi:hypothetical protein